MFGDVIEERGLLGTSLTTVLDAEGRKINFDIREDELQNEKLAEAVELLIAAGYFRARIKGISAFDKIVGGIVWCLSFCDYDVDVDLLFQENLSVGQKIALTEKILLVLNEMQCPFNIEPHQIQGLDFIHIFPVIQWLVKKAVEAKEQSGDAVHAFAEYQFSHIAKQQPKRVAKPSFRLESGFPERIYKRCGKEKVLSEHDRVISTLMEYEGSGFGSTKDHPKEERSSHETDKIKIDGDAAVGLTKLDTIPNSLLENSIADFVTDEIAKMSLVPSIGCDGIVKPVASTSTRSSVSHSGIEDDIDEQKRRLLDTKRLLEEDHAKISATLKDKQSKLQELKSRSQAVHGELERYELSEESSDKKKVDLLKELLSQRDEVKALETSFKDSCKKKAAQMEAEKEHLLSAVRSDGIDEDLNELQRKRDDLANTLIEQQCKVASLTKQISALQRKMDDTPSRLELNQYQRRFVELYNQVASLQKEAKKFYILHNTLCDVKTTIEKEISLLDSVYDAYESGLHNDQVKLQFVRQLEQAMDGLRQTKIRVDKNLDEEHSKRDVLKDVYQELLDRQRFYFKVVTDFRDECKKNELLQAKLLDQTEELDEA